ncbi:hypothetical protein KI387_023809, partial [Taxus chinensis]
LFVVHDDFMRNVEVTDDMLIDEIDNFVSFGRHEWNGFHPFGEVFSSGDDRMMMLRGAWIDEANE